MSTNSRGIGVFWWSPRRQLRVLAFEARERPSAWLRLLLSSRRLMANFGDELSQQAVSSVTGRSVYWLKPRDAELFAIGSVLQIALSVARPGAAVWGSGLREGVTPVSGHRPLLDIICVRGRHTQSALHADTAGIGDPGVLAAEIFGLRRSGLGGVGYVPHFSDYGSPKRRLLISRAKEAGMFIISPSQHPLQVVEACAKRDLILSSSLHGLVVADSLGIPALAAMPGEGSPEPRFKYQDYESAYAIDDRPVELVSILSGGMSRRTLFDRADERSGRVRESIDDVKQTLVKRLEQRFN